MSDNKTQKTLDELRQEAIEKGALDSYLFTKEALAIAARNVNLRAGHYRAPKRATVAARAFQAYLDAALIDLAEKMQADIVAHVASLKQNHYYANFLAGDLAVNTDNMQLRTDSAGKSYIEFVVRSYRHELYERLYIYIVKTKGGWRFCDKNYENPTGVKYKTRDEAKVNCSILYNSLIKIVCKQKDAYPDNSFKTIVEAHM